MSTRRIKDEIKEKAEELEKESKKHLRAHVPLSRGLTMFQVAIAVGAISVLTKRREFWCVCLAFGGFGIWFLVCGLGVRAGSVNVGRVHNIGMLGAGAELTDCLDFAILRFQHH